MDSLNFEIKQNGMFYTVYIERGLNIRFDSKRQAEKWVKKFKDTIFDNVLMFNHLYHQLSTLKGFFFNDLPTGYKLRVVEIEKRYNDGYLQIFFNRGGNEKTTVQFNKIRVCFDVIEDYLIFFKEYGQKYKRPVLLRQIEPIAKFFRLVVESYNSDLESLRVQRFGGGKLVTLNTSKNENFEIVHGGNLEEWQYNTGTTK